MVKGSPYRSVIFLLADIRWSDVHSPKVRFYESYFVYALTGRRAVGLLFTPLPIKALLEFLQPHLWLIWRGLLP